jgi:ATP-dependent Clp endopeptidase proteolytic subunit ClpP
LKAILKVDPRIRAKRIDLCEHPIVIRVNNFDDKAAEYFAVDMSDAHNTGQSVIPVVIDSFGGFTHSLIAMAAEIKSATLPIATICIGKAMSAGAFLLACGTEGYRYASIDSVIMIHELSAATWGKQEEIKVDSAEFDRLNKIIFRQLAENTGHTEDPEFFLKIIYANRNVDWYLTAKEAKKYNIINKIGIPELKYEVIIKETFE